MLWTCLHSVLAYTNLASALDCFLLISFVLTPAGLVFVGLYAKARTLTAAPLLNLRSASIWRPYFKKDGYFGVFVDQVIWK